MSGSQHAAGPGGASAGSSSGVGGGLPPGVGGGLPPGQVAEISRLLGQYSEDVEASQAAARLTADPESLSLLLNLLSSLPQQ